MFTEEEKEIVRHNILQLSEVLKKYGLKERVFHELGITRKAYFSMIIRRQNLGKIRTKRLCERFNIDYDTFISKKLKTKVKYIINVEFEDN